MRRVLPVSNPFDENLRQFLPPDTEPLSFDVEGHQPIHLFARPTRPGGRGQDLPCVRGRKPPLTEPAHDFGGPGDGF
jgi:hypothetical protein